MLKTMNLFQISNELRSIYDTIEENEGELTPELEEALNISEVNFKEKINDYIMLIRNLDGQVDQCATEAKRVATVKKSKENLRDRLKSIVVKAIEEFGNTTDSGAKYLDFGTYKVSSRKSITCEINEESMDCLAEEYKDAVRGCFYNMAFDIGKDLSDDIINILKQNLGDNVNKDDLRNLETKITFKSNALALLSPEMATLMKLSNKPDGVEIDFSASKTNCKKAINTGEVISYARLVENNSLIIK